MRFDVANLIAIPIFASEIFTIGYHNILDCPDECCYTFQKKINDNKNEMLRDSNEVSVMRKDLSKIILIIIIII